MGFTTNTEDQSAIVGTIDSVSDSVDLTSPNSGTTIVQITGTWTGTMEVQGSNNGTDYITIYSYDEPSKLINDSITANSVYSANTNGFQYLRIIATAWTSGTANIYAYGADATSLVKSDSVIRGTTDGTLIGNDGDAVKVKSFGDDPTGTRQDIAIGGVVPSNSTDTPLGAGATFTGTFQECDQYSSIVVAVNSDQPSALNGAKIEYSTDGTVGGVISEVETTFLPVIEGVLFSVPTSAKFFRVVYTNGPTAQSTFQIQTTLKNTVTGQSVIPIIAPLRDTNSVVVNRSIQVGRDVNGVYTNSPAGGVADNNTTFTPLGAGATFTGPYVDLQGYGGITVVINTDQDGTLFIEHSADGSTNVDIDTFDVVGGDSFFSGVAPKSKFFRIRYENGGVAQSSFSLQTVVTTQQLGPSSQPINSQLESNSVAVTTRSVITGLDENDEFQNVSLSPSNSLKVAQTDRPSELRDRVHVDENIENTSINATGTIIHSVTPGSTFYLTSIIVSGLNSANANGRLVIRDGASTNKVPFLFPPRNGSDPSPALVSSPPLPEPIPFTSDIRAVELAGTLTVSITIVGYEE